MDYKKLYTPTESNALYNIAKIRFDPTSYTLKGNLITNCDRSEIAKQHISEYNFKAEHYLFEKILEHEPRATHRITGISEKYSSRQPANTWSILCVQQDNLYVSLELLEHYFPLDKLKTSNVMQTLVSMCVALNSTKSCAKDLLHLATSTVEMLPYNKVCTLEWLKEALKDPLSAVPMWTEDSSVKPGFVPSNDDEISWSKTPFKYDRNLGVDTLYSHIIHSFEVVWAWSKLQDPYKECFARMCNVAEVLDKFDRAFFKKFFTPNATGFDIHPELEDAIALTDPKERYEKYQELLNKYHKDIYDECVEYYENEFRRGHYLNAIFSAMTSFAMQLGLINIRINTIRILYDYCTAHKYIAPKDSKDIEDVSGGLFGKFGALSGTSTGAKKPESKALADFEDHSLSKGGDAPEDASDHDTSAMFEALDMCKASFKSGRYSFDVNDVEDTSDENRTAYNAIASKVETVNKLLIRRIKDIKTYNVGGKNSGASTGRIDRKAIYRYKYDANIFYNNTYKTLESDLAFGIILDESGSMSGSGIKNGRTTMIVLHETLKALGINHSIIGHTSDGKHHSEISRYQSFREDKTYKVCKNYALVKTSAKNGNCDSGALYYMEKALDRVRNKDKICLIFSDGAPTECTGKELKDQVRHMEKKGIKVIGIGINFSSISKYYTDYANGRNLTDMLNIVAKILEEYVLKKKDK